MCLENNIKCSLNVNKWIPIDGIGQCGIKTHDIHRYFRVLTVGQRIPGFWDVTDLLFSEMNIYSLLLPYLFSDNQCTFGECHLSFL